MSENLNEELIVGVSVDPGPDPPADSPSESVRTLGRLFASLGGDQRGSYPRMNIVLSLLGNGSGSVSGLGASVRQLAESVSLSTSATSQHLKRLELDGIVKGRRNPLNRQEVVYSLDGGMLYDIIPLMRQVFSSLFPSGPVITANEIRKLAGLSPLPQDTQTEKGDQT